MRPLNRIVDAVREIGDAFDRPAHVSLRKTLHGQWEVGVLGLQPDGAVCVRSNQNEEFAALRVLQTVYRQAREWTIAPDRLDRVQTALERAAAVLRTFGPEYGVSP